MYLTVQLVASGGSTFLNYFWQNFLQVINVSAAFVYINSSPKMSNSVHQLLLVSGLDLSTYILLKFVPKIFDGIHVR